MYSNNVSNSSPIAVNEPSSPSVEDIQNWLISHLTEVLEIEAQHIQPEKDFTEYGLDSITMVNLSGELESFLNCRLDPTLVLSYPNIRSLSEHLVQECTASNVLQSSQPLAAEQVAANVEQMSDEEVESLLGTLLSENEDE